jgi:hypothetical protein
MPAFGRRRGTPSVSGLDARRCAGAAQRLASAARLMLDSTSLIFRSMRWRFWK